MSGVGRGKAQRLTALSGWPVVPLTRKNVQPPSLKLAGLIRKVEFHCTAVGEVHGVLLSGNSREVRFVFVAAQQESVCCVWLATENIKIGQQHSHACDMCPGDGTQTTGNVNQQAGDCVSTLAARIQA